MLLIRENAANKIGKPPYGLIGDIANPGCVVAMAAQIESESRLPYLSGVGEGIIDPIDAVLIAA